MEFSESYLNPWNLIRLFGIPQEFPESFFSRHQLEPAASSQFEWIKNHKQFKTLDGSGGKLPEKYHNVYEGFISLWSDFVQSI